jgi:hypothetical protein
MSIHQPTTSAYEAIIIGTGQAGPPLAGNPDGDGALRDVWWRAAWPKLSTDERIALMRISEHGERQ